MYLHWTIMPRRQTLTRKKAKLKWLRWILSVLERHSQCRVHLTIRLSACSGTKSGKKWRLANWLHFLFGINGWSLDFTYTNKWSWLFLVWLSRDFVRWHAYLLIRLLPATRATLQSRINWTNAIKREWFEGLQLRILWQTDLNDNFFILSLFKRLL